MFKVRPICFGLSPILTTPLLGAALAISAPYSAAGSLSLLIAQNSSGLALEEIVVTARRRSESLVDVPGSVTALTESTLVNAGVARAEDFIAMTPGVSMVNAAEVGDTQVNIRGINGARDAENSFAYLIDGILYTNPAAFNREYTDLQQIEVFKGPQGAIYGRSAAAGAILVTTKKPGNDKRALAKVSIAEDNSYAAQVGVSGPIIEDKLYFGFSADMRETDGFYRNSFQNGAANVDTYSGYNLNGRLVWDVSDNVSIDSKLRYGEVDASAIVFNSTFNLPIFAAATDTPDAFKDSNDVDFIFQQNIKSDNDQKALEFSTKLDMETSWGSVTAWGLYSDIENNLISDGTSAAFGFYNGDAACQQSVTELNAAGVQLPSPQFIGQSPVGVIFEPTGSFLGAYTPTTCDGIQEQLRDQRDASFEVRIASNTDQSFRWMAGVYYLDIERQVGVSLNRDSGEAPIRGLLQLDGPNRTAALAYDDFDTQVTSIFGQIEYDITDSLELAFALRYDNEERDVSSLVPTDARQQVIDLNFDNVFDDPLNTGLSSLVNSTGEIPDQSESYSELQPKLSLTWAVTDASRLYASYGVGFKAGGFNNSGSAATVSIFNNSFINGGVGINFADDLGAALPAITDDYDEETSDAFEVGFKTSALDGRLQFDAALFYTDVEDMQFFEFFVGSFGLLRVVSNIDEVELFGAELGATFQVSEHFRLSGGASYVDSEIKANSSRNDTVGNESPYTPKYTVNLAADFNFPLRNGNEIFARIDAQAIGETWFHTVQEGQRPTIFQPLFELGFGAGAGALGTADFSNARRDAYATVDLRAGIRGEYFSVTAFVSNLTDEKYLEEIIPAPEFGGKFDHPGTRRRAGVEFSVNF